MITHRCEGSLKHNCSIRNEKPNKYYQEDGWWLYMRDVDYDWNWTGLRAVRHIDFCPWCGVKLSEL
jgi:hypothetical protein